SWFSPRRDWKPAAASDVRPRMSLVLQSLLPIPAQLPGHEPASARMGYEDGHALFLRCRRVEGPLGCGGAAGGGVVLGEYGHSRLGRTGRKVAPAHGLRDWP